MARGQISSKITTTYQAAGVTAGLRRVSTFMGRPFQAATGSDAIAAARGVIRTEFQRGGYYNSSGTFVSWKPGHDFGDRKAQRPVLGGPSGRLGRAWLGGPGGFSKTTAGGVGIQIGVTIPWAPVHRGGNQTIRVNRVTVVRPKRTASGGGTKMHYHLGLRLNAWISEDRLRKGLRIPARPHAMNNPKTSKAVGEVLTRAIRKALR